MEGEEEGEEEVRKRGGRKGKKQKKERTKKQIMNKNKFHQILWGGEGTDRDASTYQN